MNNQSALEAARKLGFKKTSEISHGQSVFKKGNTYITADADAHSGGTWKAAGSVKDLGSNKNRWGTYNSKMKRIGD